MAARWWLEDLDLVGDSDSGGDVGEDFMRCAWANGDPLMERYHDEEWGVPAHDDRALFELLTLEGAQAGLSWRTILRRREGYRAAFEGFDIDRVAAFDERDVERLVRDERIIRHRGKIEATIGNACAILALRREGVSFDALVWRFAAEDDASEEVGAPQTERSRALSRELKRAGFRFVGPTICQSFLEAAGVVNGHAPGCFRRAPVEGLRSGHPGSD